MTQIFTSSSNHLSCRSTFSANRTSSFLIACISLLSSLLFLGCDGTKKVLTPNNEEITILKSDSASLASAPIQTAKITSLAYIPAKGDIFHYRITQDNSMEQDSGVVKMHQVVSYSKTIRDVKSDGTIEASVRFDTIITDSKYNVSGQEQTAHFNSTNLADMKDERFVQFSAVIGESVTMYINGAGEITEVSGLTSIVNKMLGAKKDSVSSEQRQQISKSVEVEFIRAITQQELQSMPDKLDSSQKWSRSASVPIGQLFTAATTINYEVLGKKKVDGGDVVQMGARLSAMVSANKLPPNYPAKIDINETKFEGAGISYIIPETGVMTYKKSNQIFFVDATMTDTRAKKSQRTRQKLETNIKVELIGKGHQ